MDKAQKQQLAYWSMKPRAPFYALGRNFYLISPLFTLSLSKTCFDSQILPRHVLPSPFQPSKTIQSDIWWTIQISGESLASWLVLAEPFHNIFWIPRRSPSLWGKGKGKKKGGGCAKNCEEKGTQSSISNRELRCALVLTRDIVPFLWRQLQSRTPLGLHHPPGKPFSLHWP